MKKLYLATYKPHSAKETTINIEAENILEATIKLIKYLDNTNIEILKMEFKSNIEL
jgi:hypothetical protein